MQYYERFLDWRRRGPVTTRAAAGQAAIALTVAFVVGTAVMGVLNLIDGQDAADAWGSAAQLSIGTVALLGLLAAAVIYADRHHRRQVRAMETEQDSKNGGADGSR